jgi:DivIVA domain-containing protein
MLVPTAPSQGAADPSRPGATAPRSERDVNFVFLLTGVLVIAAIALLAVGRLGELPEVEPDRAPLALPEDRALRSSDVDSVRFAVGMRGYRMDEVDDVLDRLASEVAARDFRISELEDRLAARGVPRPPSPDA